MARLIDANKAENALYGFTRYTGIDEAPYEHAETVIDKLPTVEAIPIEWIKGWLASIKDNERYKNAYVQIEDEVRRVAYGNEMEFNIPSVSDMLEDWEKENEVD